MNVTNLRTVQGTFYLLLALVAVQTLYGALYLAQANIPQQLLWGLEAFVSIMLATFAAAAMAQAKNHHLGWSAIAFGGVLNAVQVSIGVTLFRSFYEAAGQVPALEPVADALVDLSFMLYYAAKFLLGFAALIFAMATMAGGGKALGGLTALVGVVAMVTNAIVVVSGGDAFMPPGVAGVSGALAILLLASCLMGETREHSPGSARG